MEILLLVVLSLAIGFFAAILGIGGGVILTPTLILLGMETHIAISVSLGGVVLTSLVSSVEYLRQRLVDLKLALLMMVASAPSALAGAYLSVETPGTVLEKLMALFLLAMAGLMLTDMKMRMTDRMLSLERHVKAKDDTGFSYRAHLLFLLPIGMAAGFTAGLFGIGGGVMMVPSLLLSGVPAQVAVATSSMMVNASADVSFLTYLARGGFDLSYLLPIAPALMTGAYIGAMVSARIKPHHTRFMLAGLLVFLSAMLLLR
ncbi:sulfite exporter TauE/SafE family protein [Candidatus Micrarchaeota archaeon]|nr:sulfite exporter TauE/SafE family protein [Candidatus Micrarchaeota archaeon]